jgi:Transcriptional regulator, AbiEi antitoxin
MAGQTPQHPRRARKLAKRQHWVISRRQLIELGYTRHAIYHRVADGRLYPVFRGVFAVGRSDLSLPPDRAEGRPAEAGNPGFRERLQGRLLLA